MKNKIQKAIEKSGCKLPCASLEDIEMLFYHIHEKDFDIKLSMSGDGFDAWLQSEYYSKKLGKIIILDMDFASSIDNIQEVIDLIEKTNAEIKSIEEKIK